MAASEDTLQAFLDSKHSAGLWLPSHTSLQEITACLKPAASQMKPCVSSSAHSQRKLCLRPNIMHACFIYSDTMCMQQLHRLPCSEPPAPQRTELCKKNQTGVSVQSVPPVDHVTARATAPGLFTVKSPQSLCF